MPVLLARIKQRNSSAQLVHYIYSGDNILQCTKAFLQPSLRTRSYIELLRQFNKLDFPIGKRTTGEKKHEEKNRIFCTCSSCTRHSIFWITGKTVIHALHCCICSHLYFKRILCFFLRHRLLCRFVASPLPCTAPHSFASFMCLTFDSCDIQYIAPFSILDGIFVIWKKKQKKGKCNVIEAKTKKNEHKRKNKRKEKLLKK